MFKLVILILALGTPIGEIRTDITFEDMNDCLRYPVENWPSKSLHPDMQFVIVCEPEV